MSTPQGGTVLEREAAADWLRDHAGPNLHIGTVERGTLTVMLQVATEGWPGGLRSRPAI